MAEFSRSLAAQCAAKCIVDTAVECGVVNGPVAISPHLAESEKAKEEYAQKLSCAEAEIVQQKETARKELDASLEVRRKQAENEAAKIIADARSNAEREREKILKEAQGEIADMVTTATEKIIGAGDTSEAFDQFLRAAQRGEQDE